MMLGKKPIVGFKQVLKAIKEDRAAKVFLSDDCEAKISDPIEKAASEMNVQILYIPTMKELGEMCGIDVCASCAVEEK